MVPNDPLDPPAPTESLAEVRARLEAAGLDRADVADDPVVQVRRWWDDAMAAGLVLPETMALATADAGGVPSVRLVLLRGLDERGLVWFTNYRSRKGRDLEANARAAIVLVWHAMGRQVRAAGSVERVSDAESDAYFASRPRGSQLSAWASPQSEVVADRAELDRRHEAEEARWAGWPVERPPFWGGFRLLADEYELWQGRPERFHDRLRYRRGPGGAGWVIERLAP